MYMGLMMLGRLNYITAETLVSESSAFEIEMATEKLKRHRSSGIAEIPAELVKAGGRTAGREIYKLNLDRASS